MNNQDINESIQKLQELSSTMKSDDVDLNDIKQQFEKLKLKINNLKKTRYNQNLNEEQNEEQNEEPPLPWKIYIKELKELKEGTINIPDSEFENFVIKSDELANYNETIKESGLTIEESGLTKIDKNQSNFYSLLAGTSGKHYKQITGSKEVMNYGIGSFQHIKKTNNFSIVIYKKNNYNENKEKILNVLDKKLKKPLNFALDALFENKKEICEINIL